MSGDRGQAYTLEGIIGAILIASALVVGLQAVDISPWTGDGTDYQTESLRLQVEDLLAAASDRDALRAAVTCIDGDGNGTPHPAVAAGGAPNATQRAPLGTLLNRTLDASGNQYNVYVDHPGTNGSGRRTETRLTAGKDPTRPTVTVTRQVALFDSDPVLRFDPSRGECVPTFGENDTLAARSADPDGALYLDDQNDGSDIFAVVRVRVVAW